MPNIDDFTLKDMVDLSAALRQTGTGAANMEDVAGRVVHHLYENLINKNTGEKCCALVRFFKTYPYRELDADLQQAARSMMSSPPESPEMRCMVLLATAGASPEWNDRKQSRGHKAIPLPSERIVEASPMISQMVQQMGVELKTVLKPDPAVVMDVTQKTYNVFHVPEAVGSRYIPAQDDFVIPSGIRSVIGFGGILPSGNLFVVIMFSRVPVPRQTAEMFKSLALSVKVAILPFVGKPLFT